VEGEGEIQDKGLIGKFISKVESSVREEKLEGKKPHSAIGALDGKEKEASMKTLWGRLDRSWEFSLRGNAKKAKAPSDGAAGEEGPQVSRRGGEGKKSSK